MDRYVTDIKTKLSMLWVFVILNMLYADVLSLMDPSSAIRTRMVGTPMSPELLLAGAVLMETAIAMVVLTWLLPRTASRWANIIAAGVNILAVVTGGHGLYYIFFATIEVVSMLLIIWLAWTWPEAERTTRAQAGAAEAPRSAGRTPAGGSKARPANDRG
jgi:hypothetical protein